MKTFDDLYSKPDVDPAQELIALHKRLNEIGDSARRCLNSELFSQYKDQFEKAQSSIMDAMIKYTNDFCNNPGDVAIYALKMARYVQKIQDLKILLDQVQLDAKKGEINEQETRN